MPEDKPAVLATPQAVRVRSRSEVKQKLLEMEENVHADSMQVMSDCLHFARINPEEHAEPPSEWVEELGEARAWERFRLAIAANLPAQQAPSGLKIAMAITTSLVKARANDVTEHGPIGISVNIDVSQRTEYPVKKVIDV